MDEELFFISEKEFEPLMSQAFVTTTMWETVEFLQHKSATHIQIWEALFSFQYGKDFHVWLKKKKSKKKRKIKWSCSVVSSRLEALRSSSSQGSLIPLDPMGRECGSEDPPATSGSRFAWECFCWAGCKHSWTGDHGLLQSLAGIWHNMDRWKLYLYNYADIDRYISCSLSLCIYT